MRDSFILLILNMDALNVSLGGKVKEAVYFGSLLYATVHFLKGNKETAPAQFVCVFMVYKCMLGEKPESLFSFK